MSIEWNHRLVRAPQAWDKLPKTQQGAIDWADVAVAHLDTGYSEHPAFGPWANDQSPVIKTAASKSYVKPLNGGGRDPFTQTDIQPPGHGTKSASTLSANVSDLKGLAPGLPLVALRVTDTSLVTEKVAKAIGKALRDVADDDIAPVASISLGFPLLNGPEMGRGVDAAYEKGVIVVAAAGQVIDRMTYPGKHLRTIGVAGIERYRFADQWRYRIYQEYDFYNRVDTWAPAKWVGRATPHKSYDGITDPDDLYDQGDGTTYATVHVSAAAAIWCRHHGLSALRTRYGRSWRLVEAFRQCLFKSEARFRMRPAKQPHDTRGKMLDIKKLLEVDPPAPDDLKKEADLAADDRV